MATSKEKILKAKIKPISESIPTILAILMFLGTFLFSTHNGILLIFIAVILFLAAIQLYTIWQRYYSLKLFILSCIAFLALLSFPIYSIFNTNNSDKQKTNNATKRSHVIFVNSKLILPTNENDLLRVTFGFINTGNIDATATIKDQTYYYTTAPNQKVFKYQSTPPEEFLVQAIPNAVYNGEMRFNFQLTPERLIALKENKARLFFFARGQYSDTTGKTYPLPFSGMYDPLFQSKLVACPKEIIFE